ncbi:MAG TPA: hypothetical protein DCG75_00255 [Bacteroidales bacterium]|nr:hypothetical protein [Bacteroidales bacterium]
MLIKRYILFVTFSMLVSGVFAQNIRNKQFALIDYDLTISNDFAAEISSLEPYIESIKTYNDPGNEKLKAILVHIIYFNLKEGLENELGIEILPINTFMRNVKYDDYGYPNSNIREALRKGDSRFYFKVIANLESITKKQREESPELFENRDYPVTFPQLSIEVTVYNNEGIIPVAKWLGVSTPKYALAINEYLLQGFNNIEMNILPPEDQQTDNLYLMLDRAIHNTIQSYLNN